MLITYEPAGRGRSATNFFGHRDRRRHPAKQSAETDERSDTAGTHATGDAGRSVCLRQALDHPHELVAPKSLLPGELDKLTRQREDGSALGGARHGDTAAPTKLEQTLLAQEPQGAKDRVGVHAQHRGQVAGGWEPLSGLGLAVGNGTTDLGCHLRVQRRRFRPVKGDTEHSASETSISDVRPSPAAETVATMGEGM